MNKLIESILGGYDFFAFLGFLFWALIGAYILVQFNANNRDVISVRTPVSFSWAFWFKDNVRRVVFNGVLIIVAIRFSKDITGREINEFWSLVIGLSSDGLALLLNQFKIIKLSGTAKPDNPAPDIREEMRAIKKEDHL